MIFQTGAATGVEPAQEAVSVQAATADLARKEGRGQAKSREEPMMKTQRQAMTVPL
jgi:hypothetical protein